MSVRSIDADHARRFLVTRHLLAPPRALPAKPESVLTAVERLGLLQFDPLEVPGARNHDLVLHARVAGYRREWCEQWLYGPDRRLIELYNKSLNLLPIHELPHYRISWQRSAAAYDDDILTKQADVAQAILRRLKTDGPLSTAAFSEHGHSVDWWWAPTRASRAVMEALFVTGRIGISRRDGNRRYYDLIERLVPAELLKLKESEEAAMTHRLLSRYRATGMTMPAAGTQSEVMYSAGPTADRVRRTNRLVDEGILLPVEVEGLKATRYILADEESILDDTSRPRLADARRQLPRAAGPADLGPEGHPPRPVRVRLPVGGLRPRGEAEVGLLRPADAVRRSLRRAHRAAARPQVEDPGDRRHLVRGRLRADGVARVPRRLRRGARGVSRPSSAPTRITWPRTRAGRAIARGAADGVSRLTSG